MSMVGAQLTRGDWLQQNSRESWFSDVEEYYSF